MATLTVENVGPIKQATLEIKKHTVLIGPQGSGKSTLAKLVAIGKSTGMWPISYHTQSVEQHYSYKSALSHYTLSPYINDKSFVKFVNDFYNIKYDKGLDINLTEEGLGKNKEFLMKNSDLGTYITDFDGQKLVSEFRNNPKNARLPSNTSIVSGPLYVEFMGEIMPITSSYIPAERTLTSLLSSALWSFVNAGINLPKSITLFGQLFEESINSLTELNIPFLEIDFSRKEGKNTITYMSEHTTDLAQSASGYQAIIPLLLVVEYQRQQRKRQFIVEEPELNLYPSAQKDLIYALISGLQPNVSYQDAEWLFTTHSPYVLSSLNTLMLAYRVAQQDEESRAEVERIIPSGSWINPEEFSAYYVADGTVRSIVDPETGLIAENQLDQASEILADELNLLFELYRPLARG